MLLTWPGTERQARAGDIWQRPQQALRALRPPIWHTLRCCICSAGARTEEPGNPRARERASQEGRLLALPAFKLQDKLKHLIFQFYQVCTGARGGLSQGPGPIKCQFGCEELCILGAEQALLLEFSVTSPSYRQHHPYMVTPRRAPPPSLPHGMVPIF